jgi:CBS domain-containing protein
MDLNPVKEASMKVQDVMISPARSCTPDAAIVDAARTMWDNHCGALPVLDEKGGPVGIVTDRDICMALARKNRFPARIFVREVMTPYPFICQPQDAIEEALAIMAEYRVRRLPVVNTEGCLIGIVSISDVAAALPSGHQEVRGADAVHRMIARTLMTISAPKGADQHAAT